jgi:CRP/FNR family transcriptional regulator, cyclic AMP receptor protein
VWSKICASAAKVASVHGLRLDEGDFTVLDCTTRSRVSFFKNKFRKLGFIEYNGKLEVHNSLLHMVLHDKPEIETKGEQLV